jgi:hypothetical protein
MVFEMGDIGFVWLFFLFFLARVNEGVLLERTTVVV